jgi:hypothetical protein
MSWCRTSLGLGALLFASSAHAQLQSERASFVVEERAAAGVDDVAGLTLGVWAVGARYRVAPTLSVQASALVLRTAGRAVDREPAAGGAGGELGAVLMPWPDGAVRPFASANVGLLLFPKRPFLPGGDVYEGIISFGLGAELELSPRWSLGARTFMVHLSNGQGLGPHNPAYDGYGGDLSLRYALAPARPVVALAPAAEERASDSLVGVIADAELGHVDDATLLGGRARLFARIAPQLLLTAEAGGGSLVGEPYAEVGLGAVGHFRLASFGAYAGTRRYAGLATSVVSAQAEPHLTREVSLVAMAHHEQSEFWGETWRAGVGARLFPTESWVIDLGVGFDGINQERRDHADPYFGVEWALLRRRELQLGLFLERQISTLDLVGVRGTFGAGAAPRETARRNGWRRIR